MGSLPRVTTTYVEDATSHILYPTIAALANKTTYGDVISALNLKRGDQLTFCCVKQGNSIQESQFNFARVILDPTDPTTYLPLALDTPFLDENSKVNKPSVRNEGSFSFNAVASGLRYWYEDLYTTEEDTVAAFCIVSRKEGDTWKRSTTYIAYPGETSNAYSMQECLDMIGNGAQHAIYSGSDQYLNNAGTGGGAAVESEQGGESGGGSQGGDTPAAQSFTISTATVNNQAMTVGSPKTVYISEGESTTNLDIRVTFANVGNAVAVGLFKGNEQVGTDHEISNGSVNFSANDQTTGNYNLKVKKSDNTWEQVSYTISVQKDGGMGQD